MNRQEIMHFDVKQFSQWAIARALKIEESRTSLTASGHLHDLQPPEDWVAEGLSSYVPSDDASLPRLQVAKERVKSTHVVKQASIAFFNKATICLKKCCGGMQQSHEKKQIAHAQTSSSDGILSAPPHRSCYHRTGAYAGG